MDRGPGGHELRALPQGAITAEDLERLTILVPRHSFNGDGRLLRLGLQAHALGIAYEFDPYFGHSISRVDPLPHQLEAIYDYLLKLARVRFLLADDAGCGQDDHVGPSMKFLVMKGNFYLEVRMQQEADGWE